MAIRILDVINFSNLRNPAGDSGIQLQLQLISEILKKRDDFFFYLLMPKKVSSLFKNLSEKSNVRLLPIEYVTRQQGGAFHLNIHELAGIMDFKTFDIDVLFVNHPELTTGLLNYFNKAHFFNVPSFCYIHWMDWLKDGVVKNRCNEPGNLTILSSIALSTVTGCNSFYGKKRILDEAKKWFNETTLEKMEQNLVVLHPGIDCQELLATRKNAVIHPGKKTIIFPYRTQTYTGYQSVINHLDGLWKKRKDFRLILTNPSQNDFAKRLPASREYIEVVRLDRKDYLKTLWEADIVLGCHNGCNQWSLSAVEALAAECVPLFNTASFFPEMLCVALSANEYKKIENRYFYFRESFPGRLEILLDNLEEEKEIIANLAVKVRDYYDWQKRVHSWIHCFDRADNHAPVLTQSSEAAKKIEYLIQANSGASKDRILKHLNWHTKSRFISWTKYRKYLREHFKEDGTKAEVFFSSKENL